MSAPAGSVAEGVARPASARARDNRGRLLVVCGLALVAVLILSVFVGRYPAEGFMSPDRLASDDLAQRLVLQLRVPRLLTAMLLGMSLAAAGAVFQQIFANPLVEPGLLGVSQGAAFGASLAIVFLGAQAWLVQGAAAACAFAGLFASYVVARRMRFGGATLRLILAGITVSALFSAGVGALKYVADPLSQLPEITFWLLGGLSSVTWDRLLSIVPVVLVSLAVIWRMRWRLNLLSLEDSTAFSLGASPGTERALVLTASVAATAAVVSVCGMVAWLGLVVPHIARRLFGTDARVAIPAGLILGGLFGVLSDDIARTAAAGEIPIGIVTSIAGAAIFVLIATTYGHRGEAR